MNRTRKRIAVICPSSGGSGSVAAVAVRQTVGLSNCFNVALISNSHPIDSIKNVEYFRIRPPSFSWLRRYGHVPREIAFARYARSALAHLHQSSGLDFVLCHGHPVAALAAIPLQRNFKVPYGLVTHGDIFDRPAGTYDALLTKFYKNTTPKAYSRADLIVALSPYMRELAARSGANKQSICVIPNGIDPSQFGLGSNYIPPSPLGPGSPLRILFVGRLSVEKGVDTLLQACKRLVERNILFELRLIGDGPLSSDLREIAATLGLKERLRFIGSLPRHLLGSEYLNCHAVCVPSRSEPFATVVLEAMAAGRPVIGTNVGGIPFAVEHEKSGLLVPRDASGELANALERAARDPQMLEMMGRHGHDQCHKRFNWADVTRELSEAIGAASDQAALRS